MILKPNAYVLVGIVAALSGIVAIAQTNPVEKKGSGRVEPAERPLDKPAVKPTEDKVKRPLKQPAAGPESKPTLPDAVVKPAKDAGGTRQKIEGRAVDKDGDGIGGIEVVALRDGRAVGSGKTKVDGERGEFSFEIPSGAPVNLRFLRQPEYDPAVILQLSGLHAQNVTQVVYKQGEERSKAAEHATKMAKEFLGK